MATAAEKTAVYAELAKYTQQQAWLISPILLKTGHAVNSKKAPITISAGINAPDLYYITPA